MPSEKGAWAVLSLDPTELKGKAIEGKFIESGKHVLLLDLVRHGVRFRTNNLSQDGYRATHCLVSAEIFAAMSEDTLFNSLKIDLAGYEGWLRLGSINWVRTESTISVEYNKGNSVSFEIDEGVLSIVYEILGPMLGSHRDDHLSLNEKAFLVFRPKAPTPLGGMRRQFRTFEDLFIILTNSDYCFSWPTVEMDVDGKTLTFDWYSYRSVSPSGPPAWHECLTNFIQLRNVFGSIASNWLKKREKYGPGFYLYLGIRRNRRLYTEHLFVNLIWGLEALHRKSSTNVTHASTEARIARIMEWVKDNSDKEWLKNKLKYAHEPNLASRLYDVLSGAPVEIKAKNLRRFVDRCATIRNRISHFGEQKSGESYEEFIEEVAQKAGALSILYHAIILNEIGIDRDVTSEWIYRRSEGAAKLIAAGLLDRAA